MIHHTHVLVVTMDSNAMRVTSLIRKEDQERFTELITQDCPKGAAYFEVKSLTILLKTKSGGIVVLKEQK